MKDEFDAMAAEWDLNPMHHERSVAIVNEIRRRIPLSRNMSAMEYGAGTGIASFLLRENLKSITLLDNSPEMIRVTSEKIITSGADNLRVLNLDLEHEDYDSGRFDLIFTQMVMHHVTDTKRMLKKFADLLNKDGYLAVADLYREDGSFHTGDFGGHEGFDPEELMAILTGLGFIEIACSPCYTITKQISGSEERQYEVFLLTGKRN